MISYAFYGVFAGSDYLGSYLIDSGLDFFGLIGRGSPGGDSLFFASPKKSKQKKGDPSLRDGHPAVLALSGVRANSLHCVALKQRAALIRLKLRSSAQPEGLVRMRNQDRTPNDSFSLWEKAGMRVSAGKTPAGFYFRKDNVRFLLASNPSGSGSQSPYPSLLPEGKAAILKALGNPRLTQAIKANFGKSKKQLKQLNS